MSTIAPSDGVPHAVFKSECCLLSLCTAGLAGGNKENRVWESALVGWRPKPHSLPSPCQAAASEARRGGGRALPFGLYQEQLHLKLHGRVWHAWLCCTAAQLPAPAAPRPPQRQQAPFSACGSRSCRLVSGTAPCRRRGWGRKPGTLLAHISSAAAAGGGTHSVQPGMATEAATHHGRA